MARAEVAAPAGYGDLLNRIAAFRAPLTLGPVAGQVAPGELAGIRLAVDGRLQHFSHLGEKGFLLLAV